MNQNCGVANEPESPGESFRVPQCDAREQQKNHAVENSPEEELLSVVEPADWREFFVLVLYVIRDRFGPGAIGGFNFHVAAPFLERPEQGCRKNQSEPRMPESRSGTAAHNCGQPVQVGRPEGE